MDADKLVGNNGLTTVSSSKIRSQTTANNPQVAKTGSANSLSKMEV